MLTDKLASTLMFVHVVKTKIVPVMNPARMESVNQFLATISLVAQMPSVLSHKMKPRVIAILVIMH